MHLIITYFKIYEAQLREVKGKKTNSQSNEQILTNLSMTEKVEDKTAWVWKYLKT